MPLNIFPSPFNSPFRAIAVLLNNYVFYNLKEHRNMKHFILFAGLVLALSSCKKSNTEPELEEPYPHQWIFTMDASPDKYVYLELAGNNMKRSEVLKSQSLAQLTLGSYCEFNVAKSKTEFTNEDCVTIQFERQRSRWLFAGPSSNLQEVHLSTTGGSEFDDPGGDGYRFFIHEMPKVDGVRTVAIESVDKPGYYISNSPPGFNYSQTQVTLTQHTSPASAPAWQCRSAR